MHGLINIKRANYDKRVQRSDRSVAGGGGGGVAAAGATTRKG